MECYLLQLCMSGGHVEKAAVTQDVRVLLRCIITVSNGQARDMVVNVDVFLGVVCGEI